jgi:hypothetical protein
VAVKAQPVNSIWDHSDGYAGNGGIGIHGIVGIEKLRDKRRSTGRLLNTGWMGNERAGWVGWRTSENGRWWIMRVQRRRPAPQKRGKTVKEGARRVL